MPDPADFEALRSAVHDVCREANKGIFNHLEGMLLRLVDAIERAPLPAAIGEQIEQSGFAVAQAQEAARRMGSTERRERDG